MMYYHRLTRCILSGVLAALAALILAGGFSACEEPTEPINLPIELTVKDVGVTTVRLHLTIADSGAMRSFRLTREAQLLLESSLGGADTTITDRNLTPNTSYHYKAYSLYEGVVADSSAAVQVTTLATTSHDVTWFVDTLGMSGTIRDAAVIAPDDIWVVGEIWKDAANWDSTYNAAHWDGQKWTYYQVGPTGVWGDGIMAFASDDTWMTTGIPSHYNGSTWTRFHLWNMGVLDQYDGGVTSLWGASSTDVYFAGRKGTVVHFKDGIFTKMESGTDVDLLDVWGTGPDEVWVGGYDIDDYRSVVLHLENGAWVKIYETFLDKTTSLGESYKDHYPFVVPQARTVWTDSYIDRVWFAGGNGVYQLDHKEHPKAYTGVDIFNLDPNMMSQYHLRGRSEADLFLATFRHIFHYNGESLQLYPELGSETDWNAVCVTENTVVAVGDTPGLAFFFAPVVARGYR